MSCRLTASKNLPAESSFSFERSFVITSIYIFSFDYREIKLLCMEQDKKKITEELTMNHIPLQRHAIIGTEVEYMTDAISDRDLTGAGKYTKRCEEWFLEQESLSKCRVFLTTSGTASLEIAAILADFQPGDEVILPSFTFVSTVNAFVLRGATPVFVDIEAGTMNIDAKQIRAAITGRTKAIVPVHYAAVACDMDAIMALANEFNLLVIEDAAQAPTASYRGQALGGIGHIGCISFHGTKNFTAGGQGGGRARPRSCALRPRRDNLR